VLDLKRRHSSFTKFFFDSLLFEYVSKTVSEKILIFENTAKWG